MLSHRDDALRAVRTMRLHGSAASLGPLQRDRSLGLRDRRARVQVQPHRHGRHHGLGPAPAGDPRCRSGAPPSPPRYDESFRDLPLDLPGRGPPDGDVHAWHLYVARLGHDAAMGRAMRSSRRMFSDGRGLQRALHPPAPAPVLASDRYGLVDEQFPVAAARVPARRQPADLLGDDRRAGGARHHQRPPRPGPRPEPTVRAS